MSLFKRFTKKPTKQELESFKVRLQCGDDPNVYWQKQKELWEEYVFNKDTAMTLLKKLYNVEEVNQYDYYEKLSVWIWSSTGPCDKSPIGEHIYINCYGDLHPKKDDTPVCLACGGKLKL